jgi:hypothetical protein
MQPTVIRRRRRCPHGCRGTTPRWIGAHAPHPGTGKGYTRSAVGALARWTAHVARLATRPRRLGSSPRAVPLSPGAARTA